MQIAVFCEFSDLLVQLLVILCQFLQTICDVYNYTFLVV